MKQNVSSYLLPGILRIPGSIFALVGFVILIIRFYLGIKPEWLEFKVFAIYSAYLDVKYMTIIQNQLAEEIGGLLLFSGLYMIAFSKEKKETANTNMLRLKAFLISMWVNAVFIFVSILFVYGLGFAVMMMTNIVFILAVYIICFKVLVYRNHKTKLPTRT